MATPAQRETSRDETTRERILQVALEAFSELGFDGASTRHIATTAGVNQGLIPYYFGTKEALWQEAVARAFAGLEREVGGLERLAGDREEVALLIRRFVRFAAAHPEFTRLMHEEGKREGPRMHWIVDRHVRPLFDAITAIFERASGPEGLAARIDAVHFFYLFAGASSVIFHQAPECRRLTGRDPADPAVVEAHADAMVALFLGPDALPA